MAFVLLIGIGWSPVDRSVAADEPYQLSSDSQEQPGVPKGTVTQHVFETSQVFSGTKRRYSVYVPQQYDGQTPTALMVFQDGHAYERRSGDFRVPIVFDNLIDAGEMPITIAVMVDPGYRGDLPDKRGWKPRPQNRSVEYDTVSDDYATFLIDELLPVATKDYLVSSDPNQRAICGSSSGGIAAFTAAWFRPDAFGKVISHIGSFTDIRGGHVIPSMIRKSEPKPLRILLQDGSNDLDNQFGNWPLANQQVAKALAYRNYDFKFVYGVGGHNGRHGGAIFPDSLRWLWRDWDTSSDR
ncbi:MAG: alpha/beta hydrolase-fold protein [Planctomycetota bacterium]